MTTQVNMKSKRMQKRVAALLIGAMLAGAGGCQSDQGLGAMFGAGGGAAIGGLIGNLAGGKHRTEATLIGAGAGALLGGLIGYAYGDNVAKTKEKYRDKIDDLDSQAESMRQLRLAYQKDNAELTAKINSLDTARAEALAGGTNKKNDFQASYARLNETAEQGATEINADIAGYESRRSKVSHDQLAQFDRELAGLRAEKQKLESEKERLKRLSLIDS